MKYIKKFETIFDYENKFKIGDYVVILDVDKCGFRPDVKNFLKQTVGQVVEINDKYIQFYHVMFNFPTYIAKKYYKDEDPKPMTFNENNLRLATPEEIEKFEIYVLNKETDKYNL